MTVEIRWVWQKVVGDFTEKLIENNNMIPARSPPPPRLDNTHSEDKNSLRRIAANNFE